MKILQSLALPIFISKLTVGWYQQNVNKNSKSKKQIDSSNVVSKIKFILPKFQVSDTAIFTNSTF